MRKAQGSPLLPQLISSPCWNISRSQLAKEPEKCCSQQSRGMSENGSVIQMPNSCTLLHCCFPNSRTVSGTTDHQVKFYWGAKDPLILIDSTKDPNGSRRKIVEFLPWANFVLLSAVSKQSKSLETSPTLCFWALLPTAWTSWGCLWKSFLAGLGGRPASATNRTSIS